MTRFSAQLRADHPEPFRPHPRAVALARAAVRIGAAGGGVAFSALRQAGFGLDEIAEHAAEAERIVGGDHG